MIDIRSITDIGSTRKDNQDNFWSAVLNIDGDEAGVVCLCDGMGGLNNGGLASRIAVESVRDSIKSGTPFEELADVIKQANKAIYELGQRESQPMGTTCTVIQCYRGEYSIFHVGDSRCYRLSRGTVPELLSTDHSALKKYGITKEKDEKLWKKYRNLLTRCLGIKPDVQPDFYTGTYNRGDVFLVCSDGMWHYIDECNCSFDEIVRLPELVKNCMANGETDNITGSLLIVQ